MGDPTATIEMDDFVWLNSSARTFKQWYASRESNAWIELTNPLPRTIPTNPPHQDKHHEDRSSRQPSPQPFHYWIEQFRVPTSQEKQGIHQCLLDQVPRFYKGVQEVCQAFGGCQEEQHQDRSDLQPGMYLYPPVKLCTPLIDSFYRSLRKPMCGPTVSIFSLL